MSHPRGEPGVRSTHERPAGQSLSLSQELGQGVAVQSHAAPLAHPMPSAQCAHPSGASPQVQPRSGSSTHAEAPIRDEQPRSAPRASASSKG
jgi:hypothetical protein